MTNACTWKPNKVTLVDGTVVLSTSEAWRHECEARFILNMPGKLARQAMLLRIEERRGSPKNDKDDPDNTKGKLVRRALERTIMAIYHARQANAA